MPKTKITVSKDQLTSQIKKDLPYWIGLSQITGIGPKTFFNLVKKFGSAKMVLQAKGESLAKVVDAKIVRGIIETGHNFDPEKLLVTLAKQEIKALILVDKNYPKNLLKIYDPPPVLYIKGEILPKDEQAVAVVGSRRMTAYGSQATDRLVSQLVNYNLTIVSGLARGVDGEAHRAAIESKGRTIAVFGCGVDIIYPWQNRRLYQKIISGNGAVISEFPPRTQPSPGNFPQRNRIIAGLSLGVLVVEAAEKSGSLITANLAVDMGREVFAIPGPINYPTSLGTANLIKSGAKLVTKVDDILEELHIEKDMTSRMSDVGKEAGSKEERIIIKILSDEPKHIDQIIRESQLGVAKVTAILSLMELSGIIKQLERGVFGL